jgi:DNA modification methylase
LFSRLYKEELGKLYHGDCLKILQKFPDNSVDTVITDPPYGLKFMGKEWDRGIPGIPFWKEILRVAKPGSFLFAFGGTRTFYRLACAIEDAGWEIRDCVMWLYGEGFPKSLNISKAIDKEGKRYLFFDSIRNYLQQSLQKSGLTIKEVNEHFGFATSGSGMAGYWFANITQQTLPTKEQWFILKDLFNFDSMFDEVFRACVNVSDRPIIGKHFCPAKSIFGGDDLSQDVEITAPVSPEAKLWDGWGTALKPAWEPILLCAKPLEGTFAQNALKHKVAGLNIDGGRIGTQDNLCGGAYAKHGSKREQLWGENSGNAWRRDKGLEFNPPSGRWPANLLLSCSCSSPLNVVIESPYAGDVERNVTYARRCMKDSLLRGENPFASHLLYTQEGILDDSIPAERVRGIEAGFSLAQFADATVVYTDLDITDGMKLGIEEAKKQGRAIIYRKLGEESEKVECAGTCPKRILDEQTGTASRFFYCAKASRKERGEDNKHPTVKPLKLMEYLCKLTSTPTGGIVLDPFMGSGSTLIAAKKLGREFVGIENDFQTYQIAVQRVKETEIELEKETIETEES